MKITVVTVAFNAEKTIGDTLRSVAAQRHPAVEHLVIDGGSRDATMEVVRAHAHRGLCAQSEPDRGLYDAMNKGLAQATGDLVGFLNADDFFARTDALTLIARAAAEHPAADAVCGAVALVEPERPDRVRRHYRARGFRPWMMRYGHMPPHPGFYVRRAAAAAVGPFDLDLRVGADFEWMLRFFHVKALRMEPLDETLVGLRLGGVSTRGLASMRVINAEAVRSCRRWGVPTSPARVWSKYLAKGLQLVRRPVDFPRGADTAWLP